MDFNYQTISPDGVAVTGSDAQLLVKFSIHSELSQHKSKLTGAPVYDDIEIVTIMNPGEKEPVIVAADDFHRRRFPRQYEAFKKGIQDQQGGTPINLLFPASPSTVKQLQAFHIFTVQQLANITDSAKAQIPMGQSLVDRAKSYLTQAGAGQSFHAMEAMQAQIDQLKSLLADTGAEVPETPAVTAAPPRRGPGRPKAVKTEPEKETT
jgi:hypothetical protein